MSEHFLVNGQQATAIPMHDRGLAYGDGVFETIKVSAGAPLLLPFHLRRLDKGCGRLQIVCDQAAIQRDIESLLEQNKHGDGVLKLIVTRGGNKRGYQIDRQGTANRYLQYLSTPAGATSEKYARMQAGVNLRLCNHRLPVNPALAGIKHLNRLDNVLARSEWFDDTIDEGLMMDTSGRVVEGTMSNLFLVAGDTLLTPRLHRCGVEGVMRQFVVDVLASKLGMQVQQRDIALSEVISCDEAFICNSVVGICPIVSLDCVKKVAGATTRRLQSALKECC